MTILQCVNELEELVRINKITDSEIKLSKKLLLRFMNNQRALWLKNELNKGNSVEDSVRQSLNGIELIRVDSSTFPLLDNSGEYVLRSKSKIPILIDSNQNSYALTIRDSNILSHPLRYVHKDKLQYTGFTRFTKGKSKVTIYNQYLWLITNDYSYKDNNIKYLTLEGVFEEPEQVYIFEESDPIYINGTTGINDVFAERYPLSMTMWNYIKSAILQTDIKMMINNESQEKE